MDASVAWPPAYILKKHPRARSVKLRASKKDGLIVTVPPRFNMKELPGIFEQHRAWIVKQLLPIVNAAPVTLPTEITLPVLMKTWKIIFLPSNDKARLLANPLYPELVFFGKKSSDAFYQKYLCAWARSEAKVYLLNRLQKISRDTGLTYSEATIRDQRSRWGSCSNDKKINLSYKLIFLPAELIDHVILHELCHTVHLNHSDKFWQLLARHDAAWRSNKLALRKGDQYIPGWVL